MSDDQQYPPISTQLRTAASAAGRAVTAAVTGQPVRVSVEERDRRQAICHACDEFDPAENRCRRCGCSLAVKPWLKTEVCPIGKW